MKWTDAAGWQGCTPGKLGLSAQLVLIFGDMLLLKERKCFDEIAAAYPNAAICGCSTAGEIFDTQVNDHSLSIAAIKFDSTKIATAYAKLNQFNDSFEAGNTLAGMLNTDGLSHVMVFSTSKGVNGSAFIRGITQNLPSKVALTGGVATDYNSFGDSVVVCDGIPDDNLAVAIGFYGEHLSVGYASCSGWDSFGPERLVTKSHENTLYELDGKSALELYKKYLGEYADGLPETALFFPLKLRSPDGNRGVVRSVCSIDEENQSIVSKGEIPVGYYARMMLANYDHLIDGAADAARLSCEAIGEKEPGIAIVISCLARKMVLRQRVEEETEVIRETLGANTLITGFYSFGEIAPFTNDTQCEFHNQSITITMFQESLA